jgi:hypothetical protein
MLKRFPIHPLLFAIYPVLALYGHNVTEVSADGVVRPLLIALVGALILVAAARLALREPFKGDLVVTLFLVLFFTYGQVYHLLKESPGIAAGLARHRYLIILFAGLFVLGLISLFRSSRHYANLNLTLNVVGLILLVFPLYQIARYSLVDPLGQKAAAKWTPQIALTQNPNQASLPDVYYIILDGYSRADVIQRVLGFDNTGFLYQLRGLGFVVAQCSRSNYAHTLLSLTSSFNMDQLPMVDKWAAAQGISNSIQQSQVRREFETLGYKIVAFYNLYPWLRWSDADLYLGLTTTPYAVQSVTPFEKMVLDTTPISVYFDWQLQSANNNFSQEGDHPDGYFISQEKYKFYELPKIAKISDPTFTYVHILIPHTPFVFSPNGLLYDPGFYSGDGGIPINDHYFKVGYVDEIEYANQQIVPILTQILKDSSTPPIIVIQGDHGFGDDRFPILNAYYFPGAGSGKIYPTITPVNTFRLIFDTYFGGSYGLLPDVSYQDKDAQNIAPEIEADCK